MLSTPTFKQVPKEEKKKCSFVRVLVQNDVINVTNGEFAKKNKKEQWHAFALSNQKRRNASARIAAETCKVKPESPDKFPE